MGKQAAPAPLVLATASHSPCWPSRCRRAQSTSPPSSPPSSWTSFPSSCPKVPFPARPTVTAPSPRTPRTPVTPTYAAAPLPHVAASSPQPIAGRRTRCCATISHSPPDSDSSACSAHSSLTTVGSLAEAPPTAPRPIPSRRSAAADTAASAAATAADLHPRRSPSSSFRPSSLPKAHFPPRPRRSSGFHPSAAAPTTLFPSPPSSIMTSTSDPSLAGTLSLRGLSISPACPQGLAASTSDSFLAGTSAPSTSASATGGSHPFLVDQTPYLTRRPSAASLRSTASASSTCLASPSVAPWAKSSPAARSAERLDRLGRGASHHERIGSFGGSSFGSAADYMLAVEENHPASTREVSPRGGHDPRRTSHPRYTAAHSLTALAAAAATSTVSLGAASTASSSRGSSSDAGHRLRRLPSPTRNAHFAREPTASASASASAPPPPPPPQSNLAPSPPIFATYARTAGNRPLQPRDSAASSLSVRSTSSSSSSLHTPTPSSPEMSPGGPGSSSGTSSSSAIDRHCLAWMREAELHTYYFGSVQSRGALTPLSAEERQYQREPLALPPVRVPALPEVVEVLQEEKRSCNPLKRFASRS